MFINNKKLKNKLVLSLGLSFLGLLSTGSMAFAATPPGFTDVGADTVLGEDLMWLDNENNNDLKHGKTKLFYGDVKFDGTNTIDTEYVWDGANWKVDTEPENRQALILQESGWSYSSNDIEKHVFTHVNADKSAWIGAYSDGKGGVYGTIALSFAEQTLSGKSIKEHLFGEDDTILPQLFSSTLNYPEGAKVYSATDTLTESIYRLYCNSYQDGPYIDQSCDHVYVGDNNGYIAAITLDDLLTSSNNNSKKKLIPVNSQKLDFSVELLGNTSDSSGTVNIYNTVGELAETAIATWSRIVAKGHAIIVLDLPEGYTYEDENPIFAVYPAIGKVVAGEMEPAGKTETFPLFNSIAKKALLDALALTLPTTDLLNGKHDGNGIAAGHVNFLLNGESIAVPANSWIRVMPNKYGYSRSSYRCKIDSNGNFGAENCFVARTDEAFLSSFTHQGETLTIRVFNDIDGDSHQRDDDPVHCYLGKNIPTPQNLNNLSFECVVEDRDSDGIVDANDLDNDNDGIPDSEDAFPYDSTESVDFDKDGTGDNADLDDDNDGIVDTDDAFPFNAYESVDTDQDGIGNNADTDDDNDGSSDNDEYAAVTDPLDSNSKPITYSFTSILANTLLAKDLMQLNTRLNYKTQQHGKVDLNYAILSYDGTGTTQTENKFELEGQQWQKFTESPYAVLALTEQGWKYVIDDPKITGLSEDNKHWLMSHVDEKGLSVNVGASTLSFEETNLNGELIQGSLFSRTWNQSVNTQATYPATAKLYKATGTTIEPFYQLHCFKRGVNSIENEGSCDSIYQSYDSQTNTTLYAKNFDDLFPLEHYISGESSYAVARLRGSLADNAGDVDIYSYQNKTEAIATGHWKLTTIHGQQLLLLDLPDEYETYGRMLFSVYSGKVIQGTLQEVGFQHTRKMFNADAKTAIVDAVDKEGANGNHAANSLATGKVTFLLNGEEVAVPDNAWVRIMNNYSYDQASYRCAIDSEGNFGSENCFIAKTDQDFLAQFTTEYGSLQVSIFKDIDNDSHHREGIDILYCSSRYYDTPSSLDKLNFECVVADFDQDGLFDGIDPDNDNDGVLNVDDAFPFDNTESVDTDSDGTGNNADTDDDNDGILDIKDAFPLDSSESIDSDQDGTGNHADLDDDNDGFSDEEEQVAGTDPLNNSSKPIAYTFNAIAGNTLLGQDLVSLEGEQEQHGHIELEYETFNFDGTTTIDNQFIWDGKTWQKETDDEQEDDLVLTENGWAYTSENFQVTGLSSDNQKWLMSRLDTKGKNISTSELSFKSTSLSGNPIKSSLFNRLWNDYIDDQATYPATAVMYEVTEKTVTPYYRLYCRTGDQCSKIYTGYNNENNTNLYATSLNDLFQLTLYSGKGNYVRLRGSLNNGSGTVDLYEQYPYSYENSGESIQPTATGNWIRTEVHGQALLIVDLPDQYEEEGQSLLFSVYPAIGKVVRGRANRIGSEDVFKLFNADAKTAFLAAASSHLPNAEEIKGNHSANSVASGIVSFQQNDEMVSTPEKAWFIIRTYDLEQRAISYRCEIAADGSFGAQNCYSGVAENHFSSLLALENNYSDIYIFKDENNDKHHNQDNDGSELTYCYISSEPSHSNSLTNMQVECNLPSDYDKDGIFDYEDTDDDNDSVPDENDRFPLDPNESSDRDYDGIGDNADTDDDNDGFSDEDETGSGTDPYDYSSTPNDYDNDYISDRLDDDDDNDGVLDVNDAFPLDSSESIDTDKDGQGDNSDLDDDNDGLSDAWENQYGLDSKDPQDASADSDNDGVANSVEYNAGTDPTDSNSLPALEQRIHIQDSVNGIALGKTFPLSVYYNNTAENQMLSGIEIRLHFNSDMLIWKGTQNVFEHGLVNIDSVVSNDTDDYDTNADTDQYIVAKWESPSDWPNQALPAKLFDALFEFRTDAELNVGDSTDIGFSAVMTETDYTFATTSYHLSVTPAFTWDIDGDGLVKPLTDGLLTLRYLFGFNGETLIANAVGLEATRNTATAIEAYLAEGIENGLTDIDGDQATKPLTDGLLLLRYLFGFNGDTLISNAVGGEASRTSAESIEAYIKAGLPVSE